MEVRLCQPALAGGKAADKKKNDGFITMSAAPHRNLTGGTALEVELHSLTLDFLERSTCPKDHQVKQHL